MKFEKKLEKPIIIVGTGRCGSTMLHRLLARHEHLGWLCTFNEVFPAQTWLSVFSNLYRVQVIGQNLKNKPYFPKPFEAYKFWEHYLPGFSRRDKPQTAQDVPSGAVQPVRRAVEGVLRSQNRPRLLVKVTGWSRIAYFNKIFPDAVFIFINREHRSVVSSWVQAGWLDVTSPPDSPSWQWGPAPERYLQLWKELGAAPILSAAVKIKMDLDDIRLNIAQFPGRCLEIQYEDLITAPRETLHELFTFSELAWTPQYEGELQRMKFYNPRDKWKKYLSEEEGNTILEFFSRAEGELRTASSSAGAGAIAKSPEPSFS
jgi:hypothetical protein